MRTLAIIREHVNSQVRPGDRLADLPIDSLELIEVVTRIEDEFDIVILPSALMKLETVADLVALAGGK